MKALFACFLAFATIVVLLLPCGPAFCQTYHLLGDVNGDGWCNFADVFAIADYFTGVPPCPSFSLLVADANGDAIVNGIDATYLTSYLRGSPNPPAHSSDCPIITCDPSQSAYIELKQKSDFNSTIATFEVSIWATTPISAVSFSIPYDPNLITAFSATNILSPYSVPFGGTGRSYSTSLDIMAVTFSCYGTAGGANFPTLTHIFDLVLTAASSNTPNVDLKVIEEDPMYGPPRFFYGPVGNLSCHSIFPFSPLQRVGDINGDGTANGIDVTYYVNYLKSPGAPKPVGRWFWNIPVDWSY